MAKELKGLALGLAAGLGVVGLSYVTSSAVTRAQSPETKRAEALEAAPDAGKTPAGAGKTNKAQLVATGRTLYVSQCAGCHGKDAQGQVGPTLHKLGDPDPKVLRHIANGFAGRMPAYKDKDTPTQLDALVAYVQSLE